MHRFHIFCQLCACIGNIFFSGRFIYIVALLDFVPLESYSPYDCEFQRICFHRTALLERQLPRDLTKTTLSLYNSIIVSRCIYAASEQPYASSQIHFVFIVTMPIAEVKTAIALAYMQFQFFSSLIIFS